MFSNPMATFKAQNVTAISKAAQNNWNHPYPMNIDWATAICLKKTFSKKQIVALSMYSLTWNAQPLAERFMLDLINVTIVTLQANDSNS